MSFDRKSLLRKLLALADLAGRPSRLVIGFSGGLDSTVLLHALAQARDDFGASILAVYVDHGLHDDSGQWFRSYGNENWEFNEQGFMMRRFASINDLPIKESERKFHWALGRRPDEHPGLSELGM